MLGKDIRFIKTREPDFISGTGSLYNSPVFYTLIISPALLFIGLILVSKRRETMAGNVRLIRSQRANKIAMKRLSTAQKFLAANEKEKFLDEMFRALWGFLSDKLVIPVSELSKESASATLVKRNVPENLVREFMETIDLCEFARFAGGNSDSNDAIYKKGIEVITQIENTMS
jgi:hypothetical protein